MGEKRNPERQEKNPEKPAERDREGTVWRNPKTEMGQDIETEEVETDSDAETEQQTAR